ncbi:NnrU family protein [Agrobacterium sp. ICMP 6402]|uniref:NnrU family protein n=1 Tax=Agrobacterium sp. ICMP 6402 TaxID=2292443 RepID=UPI0012956962|nr:NnrU family protein [Agrobacterium sp. ICMP 6402]MQB11851.1 NnrU family protein [Agrobacterium sp. ICMP 6402]
MLELVAALSLFVALHSIPAVPAVRGRLIAAIGRPTYFGLYSVVSLLALGWVFYAALSVEYVPLWDVAPWQAHVTFLAAPIGLFFVLAGLLSVNPLSISVRQGEKRGAIVHITRHPVLVGFLFWSLGHVVPNGDLRSVILFGGFALFSLGGMAMTEKRARKRLGGAWSATAGESSTVPFAAILTGKTRIAVDEPMLLAAALTGLTVWWLLAGGHAALFGADPMAYL